MERHEILIRTIDLLTENQYGTGFTEDTVLSDIIEDSLDLLNAEVDIEMEFDLDIAASVLTDETTMAQLVDYIYESRRSISDSQG